VTPNRHSCPTISFVPTLAASESIRIDFKWIDDRTIGIGMLHPAGTYQMPGALDTKSGPVASDPGTLTLIAPTR
jgi:hypothetical protein